METVIKLLEPDTETIEVFAFVQSVGRNEYEAAGLSGIKPELVFLIYADEYNGQEEIEHDGKRLTVYRTYNARNDGRIEIYTEKRGGRL